MAEMFPVNDDILIFSKDCSVQDRMSLDDDDDNDSLGAKLEKDMKDFKAVSSSKLMEDDDYESSEPDHSQPV